MFVTLLSFLYGFMCLVIVLLVLIQKGKGSMGLGNMGGGNQMLFGSSGGQDIFQKTTWVLCGLLLAGALGISILKTKQGSSRISGYQRNTSSAPAQQPASTN